MSKLEIVEIPKTRPGRQLTFKIKHVIKEGSRDHVLFYDDFGAHCSNPLCETNFPQID